MAGATKDARTADQRRCRVAGPEETREPSQAATAVGRAMIAPARIASARNVPSGDILGPPLGALGV